MMNEKLKLMRRNEKIQKMNEEIIHIILKKKPEFSVPQTV